MRKIRLISDREASQEQDSPFSLTRHTCTIAILICSEQE